MSMSESVSALVELELDLNNLERLILAQAVYELGSDAWPNVSTILSHHPLISKRDNSSFSPSASFPPPPLLFLPFNSSFIIQACKFVYENLLQAFGLSRSILTHLT
jgi:hypothetical protein